MHFIENGARKKATLAPLEVPAKDGPKQVQLIVDRIEDFKLAREWMQPTQRLPSRHHALDLLKILLDLVAKRVDLTANKRIRQLDHLPASTGAGGGVPVENIATNLIETFAGLVGSKES